MERSDFLRSPTNHGSSTSKRKAEKRRRRQDGANRARRLAAFELLENRHLLAGTVGLVLDINSGTNPSNPSQLTECNGQAFFVADDGVHGAELWISDGTSAGTMLVEDINPGSENSHLAYLTNVNGTLFFRADDGVNGAELWKSDGTAAGTVMVCDIQPGSTSSQPAYLTNFNGTVFFQADGPTDGRELWKSDGTAAGTIEVKDTNPAGSSQFRSLTPVGDLLFFVADDRTNGYELWRSDGTTAGTILVKDIYPGTYAGYYGPRPYSSNPRGLVNFNGVLFFGAEDATSGYELWKSDGSAAGTVQVKDIVSGSDSSYPFDMTVLGDELCFTASDGFLGNDGLWKTDGTTAGTVFVADIDTGRGFTNVNGTLFFQAFSFGNGYELWKSDGTGAGTVQVKDIRPGNYDSNPTDLTNFNGNFYFSAQESVAANRVLWFSDGTDSGTIQLSDVTVRQGFLRSGLLPIGNRMLFAGEVTGTGQELFALGPPGNPPTDLALSNSTLPENQPLGTTVGSFSTTDPDVGDTFTYSLVPGAGSADNARFAINGSGQLNTAAVLNFEAQSSYSIRVRTRDQTGQWFDKPFVITVTNVNDPPRITSSAVTSATEDSAYSYSITTQDDEGDSRTLSATTLPAWLTFADNGDGTATLSGVPTNGEVGPQAVVLQVTGSGGTTQQAFTINVANTNDPPSGLALSSAFIPENLPKGTLVGKFTTTDIDVGDTFTYSLVSGTGSSGNGSFKIIGDTLRTNAIFDLNVQGSFSVRVRTTDQGGLSFEKALTITIVDANDAPTFTSAAKTAATEDVAYNYNVTTHDDDGNLLILSATTLPAWLTFTDHGDGTATLSGTPTNAQVGQHSVVLEAFDGFATVQQSFTINVANVNDAPTALNLSAASIAENRLSGALVGSFSTTDVDAGNTFIYSLVSGTGSDDNAAFSIVGNGLRTAAAFNFEAKSSYAILVRTTDQGGLHFEKTFTISVLNVNDAPRFASTVVPPAMEDAAYSYLATALDEDGDPLTIVAKSLPAWLSLTDHGDGTATLSGTPANANVGQHNVLLEAKDGTAAAGQWFFTITVINTNDAPVLNTALTPTLTTIAEDATTPGNTLVSSLLTNAVTDVDAGALRGIAVTTASNFNGTWQYLLNTNGAWTGMNAPDSTQALLLPSTARVRFLPKANFNGQVSLQYRAWDQTAGLAGDTLPVASNSGGQFSLSTATETARLTVTPVNDAPVLNNKLNPSLGSIPEETSAPAGTLVSSLIAGAVTDVDTRARRGIAVYSAPIDHGHWQFMLDGTHWQEMGSPKETACLLLPSNPLTKVRFLPMQDFYGTVVLKYRAWDQTAGSAPGPLTSSSNIGGSKSMSTATEFATLTVSAVNDLPKLVLGGSTLNYVHNTTSIRLAPTAIVSDIDSPDFLGGQLRVRFISGASPTNRLTLGTNFTIDANSNVRLGTTLVGKRISNGFGANDLVIKFYSGASIANVQQLVRAIKFSTVNGSAGVRRIAFTLSDGDGGTSAEVNRLVNVT